MTLKTTVLAGILVLAPLGAFAMGCKGGDHGTSASNCLEGQIWDFETQACVDIVSG